MIKTESKPEYLAALEKADAGDLEDFTLLIGENLKRSLELYLRAARNQPIDEPYDLDKAIRKLQEQLQENKQ